MLLNCRFYSPMLRRNTQVNVILPTPGEEDAPVPKDVKVLYLLHGMHGDANSWLHSSNIERYADKAGIAVVMPSVNNSFYQDMVHGERFFSFMTEELPKFVQGLFPVSRKREDTYIAGLSMGGYGAYYIGLSQPEKYAAIASFSGALDVGFRYTPLAGKDAPLPFYVEDCFGDPGTIAGSDRDVFRLYEKTAEKGQVPRLYQSCGTADFLYGMNVAANKALTKLGADITWREAPGVEHEWDFWDSEIRWLLENWL